MSTYASGGPVAGSRPVILGERGCDFTVPTGFVPLSALSRHEVCLLRTAELENELFGGIVSVSVRGYIEAWLNARQTWTRAQYGGSRVGVAQRDTSV